MNNEIVFSKLTINDSHKLYEWLQLPHIREFWDNGLRTEEQVINYYFQDNNVARYIIIINQKPVGYIQSYYVDDQHPYKQFIQHNKKTIGVDFFIGNQEFLGKGLAHVILDTYITDYCNDANAIFVDPNQKNSKAIHIYQNCGFTKIGVYHDKMEMHDIMKKSLEMR